jgi:ECF transporter S component (folate family)
MKNRFLGKRMAMNSLMIALYVCMSMLLSITIGGLKITFESLPVVISAVAFGPVDAMIVGFMGELINQLLTFGLTPTTALWILPYVIQGLLVGSCVRLMKKRLSVGTLAKAKTSVMLYIVCIFSGMIVSCLNTLALYVDSKMLGYYSYAMVFGVFWVRIGMSVLSATAVATVVPLIVGALRSARLLN